MGDYDDADDNDDDDDSDVWWWLFSCNDKIESEFCIRETC